MAAPGTNKKLRPRVNDMLKHITINQFKLNLFLHILYIRIQVLAYHQKLE